LSFMQAQEITKVIKTIRAPILFRFFIFTIFIKTNLTKIQTRFVTLSFKKILIFLYIETQLPAITFRPSSNFFQY
ncbi:MAG: hypothetical protein ABI850_06885, partial [Flavobacterium sp.]